MAVVVSHAMRRYSTSPPGSTYPSHCLEGEASYQDTWSGIRESSLSRSMRYAEPWLYGSVRGPPGLLLAPALVLCSCSEYLNGTKRSSKKGPVLCKKCKGTRLPFPNPNETLRNSTKFGTVRCYPTASAIPTVTPPIRSGTVRASSHSRPSILPTTDPYEVMRRSRLSPENGTQFRIQESKNFASPKSGVNSLRLSSSNGRKSILECNINPYDLMSLEPNSKKDNSIKLVGGQRVRINSASASAASAEQDYEEVKVQSSVNPRQSHHQPSQIPKLKTATSNRPKGPTKIDEKESDSNRFKSILKKPTTFSDTDSSCGGPERSPSPAAHKSGSHFYLPMPMNTPRKKVQFLVENEFLTRTQNHENESSGNDSNDELNQEDVNIYEEVPDCVEEDVEEQPTPVFQKTINETLPQDSNKVVFHDTMALRSRSRRIDSRNAFDEFSNLQRLDGIAPRRRSVSPPKTRSQSFSGSSNNPASSEMRPLIPPVTSLMKIVSMPAAASSTSLQSSTASTPSSVVPPASSFTLPSPTSSSTSSSTLSSASSSPVSLSETSRNYTKILLNPQHEQKPVKNSDHATGKISIKNTDSASSRTQTQQNSKEIKHTTTANDNLRNVPPAAPPRKRSNNKQSSVAVNKEPRPKKPNESVIVKLDPQETSLISDKVSNCDLLEKPEVKSGVSLSTIKIEPPQVDYQNRTVVQIHAAPTIHKIQIKNEFPEVNNVQTVTISDNAQRKTSIMITGDDCYSTVNVNDDVPMYQSSVVVKDTGAEEIKINGSSSIYITGNFVTSTEEPEKQFLESPKSAALKVSKPEKLPPTTKDVQNDTKKLSSVEDLKQLLKDPVEAVKRNLVPHVCGKSDVSRRRRDNKKLSSCSSFASSLLENPLETNMVNLIEDSLSKLRNYESCGEDEKDLYSDYSSSTPYETMDPGSDSYTDNSNRSSMTEEELNARTKFYEMLADSAIAEISETEDHHYESIKLNGGDPIYEEITPPPLPSNPPPSTIIDDLRIDKQFTTRSIFEGASKYDILSYLVDAKERGIVPEDTYNFGNSDVVIEEDSKEAREQYRVSHLSSVSDSSEDSSLVITNSLSDEKSTFQKSAEVERNDSGVGSETSKSSLSRFRTKSETALNCEDCETPVESQSENEPLICRKCCKKRSERKEIITEIVETEEKYSRDLQIILEEFYQPMLVAGLLTPEQLAAIFLNVEELLENSQALAERLRDAVEIAVEQGDEDLQTVNIGKIVLEAAPMLHGFETYCIRQGNASLLLASLEKEKELLRIFLRVSQMENTMLRRMNLNSFLMVPVQRVTKYPLLLNRLYKSTPAQHETRDHLKEAQHKIELHLNHMNSETKDVPSKLWRRIGSNSGRRSSSEMDLVSIKLRKIAVDVLEWNHDEAKFALEGKLLFTQPTDNNWRKGRTIKLAPVNALLVTNGKQMFGNRTEEDGLTFPRNGIREAALLLVRDKNGRYSLLREPLYLDRCVIATDPSWQSYFEVQEVIGKDTFIFKAEDDDLTRMWYRQLQFHAQGLGGWRKRRNALANIMINGMGLRS